MVALYHEACSHAVQLQNFFANKSNLRGQWCEKVRAELQWFLPKLPVPLLPGQPDPQASDSKASSVEDVAQVQDILRNLKMHEIAISILEATDDDQAAAGAVLRAHRALFWGGGGGGGVSTSPLDPHPTSPHPSHFRCQFV